MWELSGSNSSLCENREKACVHYICVDQRCYCNRRWIPWDSGIVSDFIPTQKLSAPKSVVFSFWILVSPTNQQTSHISSKCANFIISKYANFCNSFQCSAVWANSKPNYSLLRELDPSIRYINWVLYCSGGIYVILHWNVLVCRRNGKWDESEDIAARWFFERSLNYSLCRGEYASDLRRRNTFPLRNLEVSGHFNFPHSYMSGEVFFLINRLMAVPV